MKRSKRGPYVHKPPRQAILPGTQDRKDARLEACARAYVELRAQRMDVQKREADAAGTLLARLEQSGKTVYACNGFTVAKVDGAPKVKVQIASHDQGDDTDSREAQESVVE